MPILNTLKNRKILSWSFYDFANQPFSTIVVTFLYSSFFVQNIAPNEVIGTKMWTNGIVLSAVIVSLTSPIIGAIADAANFRRRLLVLFTFVCSFCTMLLYFPRPGDYLLALFLFVIANITFEICSVLYNSYLIEISDKKNIGSISGFAWGAGYFGGIISLLLCFFLFDLNEINEIRRINILVGIWFLFFSIPFFLYFNYEEKTRISFDDIKASFLNIRSTFKGISKYRIILKFLIARLFYNDALITIFTLGGIYAVGTLDFTFNEVIILGIVLNISAGIGSIIFGYFEDIHGFRKIINLTLLILTFATILAFIAPYTYFPKQIFWISGILIGLMVGPNQSCSRALMARLTPDDKKNQFFGFFSFAGKATSFIGPFLFGVITVSYNQQTALLVVVLLFFIGFFFI